ncbi:YDG domain-containing protein [Dyella subtropica]|uniref:YDG domain-containing protein n=1 Tax=Dyella subtropica TaxID=2992127 RepID=UPI0022535B84|nr:YDG domain-containing protein [Dyella subtropica]
MNRIYRLVWNAALQLWVAVTENAKARGKSGGARTGGRGAVAVVALVWLVVTDAQAADASHATVTAGTASVSTSGTTTTIDQRSQRAVIDWTTLSTSRNEALVFNQPNAQAIVLNRIVGSSPTVLQGSLSANGQVFILNPNGVLFGAGSQTNVGGLVASTLGLSNADFMAGGTTFTKAADGSGAVVNQGSLRAAPGGYIALLAPQVRNEGVISARLGTAALAAGNKVTLDLDGNSLLGYTIDQGAVAALVENGQLIQADGGRVLLSARAADALASAAVNNTGMIEARTVANKAGRILLLGDMDNGTVRVGGTLDASASGSNNGGTIETSGAHVQVANGATVSTRSDSGKTGTWLIDPTDFTISSGSAAATNSGIGATTLANNLATTNVALATDTSAGSDSGDINVNAAVSWSANTTLTLNAYHNINVNAAITASGASAGLVLNYGNYASAGSASAGTDYNVKAPISLSGASASLSIDGTSYTLVHTISDLAAINNNLSGRYALAQDQDYNGTTFTQSLIGGSGGFSGTFAGLGHQFSNLSIGTVNGGNNAGLFAWTNTGSVVRDIGIVNGDIEGGSNLTGLLVGFNSGSISNSYATGKVRGEGYVGGLVGRNASNISNSYAAVAVHGYPSDGGGLVGENGGTISDSYATGSVDIYQSSGGLVGENNGTITRGYATGKVTGQTNVGGLVGYSPNYGVVNQSWASGAVSGPTFVGGLVGYMSVNSKLTNTYWDSDSTGQGGTIGYNDHGTVTNVNAVGASSRYNHGSYVNLGTWTETAIGSGVWVTSDHTWAMAEGSSRPFLYSEYSAYIRNVHQLQLMAVNPAANYALGNGIDASETSGSNASGMWSTSGFMPVGHSAYAFTGSLEGNSQLISGLSINEPSSVAGQPAIDYAGLFGYIGAGGAASDVGMVNASVSGVDHVAALAGYNAGSITNSYVTGTVISNRGMGGSYVGGLVGENIGSVSNTYSLAAVTTTAGYVGGLVGANRGSVSNSYANGTVTGGSNVEGLVGIGGPGSVVSNSFWNKDTSGLAFGSYGTGLTTAQMPQASIYVSAGWDVSTTDGSSSVWRIYDGNTAPLLRSFLTPVSVTATGVSAGKTYDGTVASGSTSYTVSNSSATLLGSGLTYTTSSAKAGSYDSNAGTLIFSGLYSNQQGYDIGYADASLPIAKATLGVSASAASKTYDGTTAATVTGTLSGVIAGDAVTLAGSGSFSDKNVSAGKTVSETFGLSGSDAGNYVLASNTGTTTANINPLNLIATGGTVANKIYDGTKNEAISGGSLSGVLAGDSVSLIASASFSNKNVGSSKSILEVYSLGGSDVGNYVLTGVQSGGSLWSGFGGVVGVTAQADITRVMLTVSGTSAASKTYDGTTAATISGGVLSGVIAGDAVTLSQNGTFDTKNVGTGKTVTESFGLNGSDAGNYILTSTTATTTANIAAATLAVSGASAANKVYDGTTNAAIGGGMLSGLIGGDNVSLSEAGAFDTRNVGIGKTVTETFGLSGSDAGNYILASNTATTTANIAAAALTVSGATAANKIYDGTTAATIGGGVLSGVIGGDSVSLSQAGTFDTKNVGTGKTVNETFGLSGSDASNYVLASNTAVTTANVSAATLTASGAHAANKIYDGATNAAVSGGALSGVIGGDSVSLSQTGAFDTRNVGIGKTVTESFGLNGSDAGNYILASNTATTTANIAAAALTVSGATAANKTYDGTTAATIGGGVLSGVIGGDSVSLSQTGTFGTRNVGAGKTVTETFGLSGSDAGNYLLASNTATTTANIAAAALTVSGATAANKTYDGTTAATIGGGVLSGVIGGDSVSLSQAGTFDTKNVGTGKTVNETFGLGGSDASNYVLASNTAVTTANVRAATLTVSGASAANKVYDGTVNATVGGGVLSGVIGGDNVLLGQTGAFDTRNVGVGKNVTETFGLSGSDAGNYILASNTATTTANIAAATLTVSGATATNKIYDATTTAAISGGVLNGLISGDNVSLSQTGLFDTKNVGTGKAVTETFGLNGSDAGNYVLASTSGRTTADINAATLTVSGFSAANKIYDSTTAAVVSGGVLGGVITGDHVVLNQTGMFGDKNAGKGKTVLITNHLSGTDAGNYVLAASTATADITAATLTASGASAASKIYDGTTAAAISGGLLSGVIGGDSVSLSQAGTFDTKNAGTGKTVTETFGLSGSDAGNYRLLSHTAVATADVNARIVSGSMTADSKTYDGSTLAITHGVLAGTVAGDAVNLVSSGVFNDKTVATGKTVSVKAYLSGADAGNYVLSSNGVTTADISAAPLMVSGAKAADKVYDGTAAATISGGVLSGVVAGDSVSLSESGTFDSASLGSGKKVSETFALNGKDAGNYVLTDKTATSTATIFTSIGADNGVANVAVASGYGSALHAVASTSSSAGGNITTPVDVADRVPRATHDAPPMDGSPISVLNCGVRMPRSAISTGCE